MTDRHPAGWSFTQFLQHLDDEHGWDEEDFLESIYGPPDEDEEDARRFRWEHQAERD